jgi:hypothetical protein
LVGLLPSPGTVGTIKEIRMKLRRKASLIVAGVATAGLLAGGTMIAHADEVGSGTPPATAVDSGGDLSTKALNIGDILRACRAWVNDRLSSSPVVWTVTQDEDGHQLVGGHLNPDNENVVEYGVNAQAPGESPAANNRHARLEIARSDATRYHAGDDLDAQVQFWMEFWQEGRHIDTSDIQLTREARHAMNDARCEPRR